MPDSIARHDSFASLYDLGMLGDWFYRPARRRAVRQLHVKGHEIVFDLFCGTGLNFPLLFETLGPEGKIIGIDGSRKMLSEARNNIEEPEEKRVELMQSDFTTTSGIQRTVSAIRQRDARRFLFTLGLTCLPNWRQFFDAIFDAAPAGSRFAIMDVYNENLSLGARLMNWVAYSETRRPVWKGLEDRGADFQFDRKPFRLFGRLLDVSVVTASGRKP
jgi:demethylmenaquinone methyltransferase/2-methoxy-6-polyprenyl-1,4-benzoquinol methylase